MNVWTCNRTPNSTPATHTTRTGTAHSNAGTIPTNPSICRNYCGKGYPDNHQNNKHSIHFQSPPTRSHKLLLSWQRYLKQYLGIRLRGQCHVVALRCFGYLLRSQYTDFRRNRPAEAGQFVLIRPTIEVCCEQHQEGGAFHALSPANRAPGATVVTSKRADAVSGGGGKNGQRQHLNISEERATRKAREQWMRRGKAD